MSWKGVDGGVSIRRLVRADQNPLILPCLPSFGYRDFGCVKVCCSLVGRCRSVMSTGDDGGAWAGLGRLLAHRRSRLCRHSCFSIVHASFRHGGWNDD